MTARVHRALRRAAAVVEEYVRLGADAAELTSATRRMAATEAIARRVGLQALPPPCPDPDQRPGTKRSATLPFDSVN
jgi:hypothetical protein